MNKEVTVQQKMDMKYKYISIQEYEQGSDHNKKMDMK